MFTPQTLLIGMARRRGGGGGVAHGQTGSISFPFQTFLRKLSEIIGFVLMCMSVKEIPYHYTTPLPVCKMK